MRENGGEIIGDFLEKESWQVDKNTHRSLYVIQQLFWALKERKKIRINTLINKENTYLTGLRKGWKNEWLIEFFGWEVDDINKLKQQEQQKYTQKMLYNTLSLLLGEAQRELSEETGRSVSITKIGGINIYHDGEIANICLDVSVNTQNIPNNWPEHTNIWRRTASEIMSWYGTYFTQRALLNHCSS